MVINGLKVFDEGLPEVQSQLSYDRCSHSNVEESTFGGRTFSDYSKDEDGAFHSRK